jgi:hypothetical protein
MFLLIAYHLPVISMDYLNSQYFTYIIRYILHFVCKKCKNYYEFILLTLASLKNEKLPPRIISY